MTSLLLLGHLKSEKGVAVSPQVSSEPSLVNDLVSRIHLQSSEKAAQQKRILWGKHAAQPSEMMCREAVIYLWEKRRTFRSAPAELLYKRDDPGFLDGDN